MSLVEVLLKVKGNCRPEAFGDNNTTIKALNLALAGSYQRNHLIKVEFYCFLNFKANETMLERSHKFGCLF